MWWWVSKGYVRVGAADWGVCANMRMSGTAKARLGGGPVAGWGVCANMHMSGTAKARLREGPVTGAKARLGGGPVARGLPKTSSSM